MAFPTKTALPDVLGKVVSCNKREILASDATGRLQRLLVGFSWFIPSLLIAFFMSEFISFCSCVCWFICLLIDCVLVCSFVSFFLCLCSFLIACLFSDHLFQYAKQKTKYHLSESFDNPNC